MFILNLKINNKCQISLISNSAVLHEKSSSDSIAFNHVQLAYLIKE